MAEIVWESDAQSSGFTVMSNGMVWPDDWPGTLVEAQFTSARGDGADLDRDPDMVPSGPGRVTFTPQVRTVGYDGVHGKRIVSLHPFEAVVGDDGYLYTPDEYGQPGIRGIVLPSNNSDVVDEHDWTWRVTFDIPDTTIRPTHIPTPHDHSVDIKDYLDSDANYGAKHVVDHVSSREAVQAAREARQARAQVESVRDETEGLVSGATSTLADHVRKLERVEPGDDRAFRVRDHTGHVALEVTENGDVHIGDTAHRVSDPVYRIMDKSGHVALEVDEQGRTHIYDGESASVDQEITTLHVFVAAGQSNMSGRGRPVEGPQSPRILQFGATRRVIEPASLRLDMVDSPSGTSPALFFAQHYLATQPDHVGVLLIPAARGATGFSGSPGNPASGWTWTKGAASSPEYALYERSVEQTLEAVDAAKDAGYHAILKGVLWHQGEGNGGMVTETYAALLDNLITDYRIDLDHPTLPFMVGQQSPEGMEVTPAKYTVDAAHRDTPYRAPFTGFAPATWDGHNEGDTTHFSTLGVSHLGDTYMTAYTQSLGNTFTKE